MLSLSQNFRNEKIENSHKLWRHSKFIETQKIRTSHGHILNSYESKKLELVVNNEFTLTFRALVIAVHKKALSY